VVEQTDCLGGNTQTYTDPNTGAKIELGVQFFHSFPVVINYFTRLGVAYNITPIGRGSSMLSV
jgi:Flavin containing amine oxidoreductase